MGYPDVSDFPEVILQSGRDRLPPQEARLRLGSDAEGAATRRKADPVPGRLGSGSAWRPGTPHPAPHTPTAAQARAGHRLESGPSESTGTRRPVRRAGPPVDGSGPTPGVQWEILASQPLRSLHPNRCGSPERTRFMGPRRNAQTPDATFAHWLSRARRLLVSSIGIVAILSTEREPKLGWPIASGVLRAVRVAVAIIGRASRGRRPGVPSHWRSGQAGRPGRPQHVRPRREPGHGGPRAPAGPGARSRITAGTGRAGPACLTALTDAASCGGHQ